MENILDVDSAAAACPWAIVTHGGTLKLLVALAIIEHAADLIANECFLLTQIFNCSITFFILSLERVSKGVSLFILYRVVGSIQTRAEHLFWLRIEAVQESTGSFNPNLELG